MGIVGLTGTVLLLGAASRVTGDSPSPIDAARAIVPASSGAPAWLPSQSCAHCHAIDDIFSHPINFAPSRTLPGDFPLESGLFTCTTCHAVGPRHRRRPGNPGLRADTTGTAFCAECHGPTQVARADMHAFVLGVAHTRLPGSGDTTEPPDFAGASCLTCHDGSLVTNLSHPARRPADFADGTHPFAIDYRLSEPGDFAAPLTPADSLDRRIRLSRGQMDCGSCHSLYSPIDNLLVMENRASALCLSCHQY